MQMKFQGGMERHMERYVKLYEAKVQSLKNLGWNTDELRTTSSDKFDNRWQMGCNKGNVDP
jgi:hypothetical protein